MALRINNKEIKSIAIDGKPISSIAIDGEIVWQVGGGGNWQLDENGYVLGEDGKYYERWFDDSDVTYLNPILDLNSQWVEDTVSGALNVDENYDYYMSNSNYHVGNAFAQFKVSWSGITQVSFLYRSYGESGYDYLVINGLDKPKFETNPSSNTSGILAHTNGKPTTTYNTLTIDCDEGEHFLWFCYRKDVSGDRDSDRAFVGIPNNLTTGELIIKRGNELRYAYIKSNDVEFTREGYGKFKYYKTYYSPNNKTVITTTDYVLGEEEKITPITDNYLRFAATTNDVHIGWEYTNKIQDFEYSFGFYETFQEFPDDGVDVPQGSTLYLRGNGFTNTSTSESQHFTTSDLVECHGDVRSILSKDNYASVTLPSYAFASLFYQTNITTAPELPATKLSYRCYNYMFRDCTSLTTAPELPATTLANQCYSNMFQSCSKLTTAPELPATTLANDCYSNMFQGCTSLTTAPELPATTLANQCYYYMFQGCKSLTQAPSVLPATTLATNCYDGMFNGCKSLTQAPSVLPATTLADYCYRSMFSSCTNLTTAPELPATQAYQQCYKDMFRGCNSLTTAPSVLPATTLASSCYDGMFKDCTSLTQAPSVLPATTLANQCYSNMFQGCKSLTTAPELPATTLANDCYYYMFQGCKSLTQAPSVLPATTLATNCYFGMFRDCTSLTTAPELPATTLVGSCYFGMFNSCSKLNYINVGATSWNTNYTTSWVNGVSSAGTFIKPSGVEIPSGTSGIPNGWNVVEELEELNGDDGSGDSWGDNEDE